jgi:serine protease Do
MYQSTLRCAVVAAGLLCVIPALHAQNSRRRTPIVEAVDKTRDGIVTLKVTKVSDWGKKSVVGTGVIVDERGYLITNAHVVDGASKVMATLADKTVIEAKVQVELPKYDLAILRLVNSRKKLKALSFGPGSDVMVGETVIAVGNPYGYTNTVSTGIVSALGREITMPSQEVLTNLIQHAASINPGNSGGPLLNVNGEVIGINVALREGAQGIGFAINADTVKDVLRKHLSAVKVSKVGHGLKTEEKVESEGKDRQNVIVEAAASEDVKKGDVIVSVGALKVANRFDLERALWGYKAGDKVEVCLVRDGKRVKTSLTLSGAGESVSTRGR